MISPLLSGRFKGVRLEIKHFFSGAAVYINGKICVTLTPVGLALKLPEASRRTLLNRKGTKTLRYFPKGPIKKDYIILPNAMIKDKKALHRWITASLRYVRAS